MARSVGEIKKRMAKPKSVEEDELNEVRPGYERLDDIKRRVNRDSYHKTQSERINSILWGAQNYFSSFQDKLDSMTWENASQVNDQITADSSRMLSEYNEVRNYLDTHGDRLDKDTYTALEEFLKAMESARVQAQSFASDRNSYFASFDSEESYIRGAEENSEKRQQRYEDNQKRIEDLKAEWEAYEYDWTDTNQRKAANKRHDDIQSEIQELEAENRKYERGEDGYISKTVDDHRKVVENEDFAVGSTNRDYTNATRDDLWNYDRSVSAGSEALSNGGYFDEDGHIRDSEGNIVQRANAPVIEDKLGMFLQATDDDITEAHAALSATNGNYTDTWAELLREGDHGSWKYLTEQELGIYYYYLDESQEKAYKYLSDMKTELNRRQTLDENGQWHKAYDESGWLGKVGMNLATVPLSLISNVTGTVEDVGKVLSGEEINPYSAAHGGMHYSQTVRGATAADLDETGFKIPGMDFTLGDLYQSGMSMVDSLAAMGLAGAYGGVLLAGGAAENEAYRLYQQGASAGQIAFGAAAAGATEMIFESISIGELDKIKNMKSPETLGQFFKTLLVQGGVEASEEALTEVANTVANAFIMGSESDWAALMEENGGNLAVALMDKTLDVLHSGLGGFFSGAGSGSIVGGQQYAINKLANNAKYRNAGGVILGTDGGVERLAALAKELDGISAYGLGKQVEAVSKKATAKNVGKLLTDVNSTVNKQNSQELATKLTEMGMDSQRAGQIADAVISLRSDYRGLTTEQTSLLAEVQSDKRVLTAVNEVLDTEGSPAYQRSAQLRAVVSAVASAAEGERIATDPRNDGEVTVESLARETVEAQYAQEDGAGLDGISAEGRAIYGKQAVDVVDIDQAGGGKITVKLTDGRSVDATALEYEDDGEAELWRVIGKYAEDAESARALLEEYRKGDLDAYKYARGVEEGFLYGKLNMSAKEMELQGSYVSLLNPMQRNMAYKQGVIAGQKKAQQRKDKLDAAKKKGNDKKGQLHFEGDKGKLTNRQKVSLQTCEIIAKALGIQVYVFESEKGAGTKRVGENGWYDPKDGSIHIDLHAGQNGEGVMVFTLAHELTHFIRDWSPKKFRVLSGFLAEQYAKKGQSVDLLVRQQMKKAEDDGRKLSYEEAHEEWVADSMETMLSDGTIVEKLAMLQAKDKGLVEKIKSFLDGFLKRLKATYQGISPQTQEGQIVGEMVDAAQELQDLFADALLDAGENFRTAEKNTTGEGGVRFSMRYSDAIEKLNDGTLDRTDNTHLKLLDNTPQLYIDKAGAKNLKIIMAWDVAYLAMNKDGDLPGNYHGLGKDVMKQLPVAIENPLYIVKQKNGRIAAVTEMVVKGKRPVFASIELDTYKATRQDGVNEDENYNLVVTVMNARISYLKNTIFSGEVVYNKNNEAPANFILRLNSLNKALPNDDLAKASNKSIRNPGGIVKEKDSTEKRTSSRSGAVSDRGMLVDMFEQMVTGSDEYRALQNYKKNIEHMLALEEKVDRLSEEIKRVSFAEGPRDMEYLNNLKQQRKKAVAELNRYDNILLGLEKSGVLRSMIERNRQVIRQETKDKVREYYRQKNETREAEIRQYYRESRRQAVERHNQAEVRQRIRKDVQRLDSLLNKGTKEKNVKLELKEFAGAALRTAKGTFLKNYDEYEMIRSGVNATMPREQKAVFARCQELLAELDKIRDEKNNEPSPDNFHEKWDPEAELRRDDREEALKKELAKNMKILRDAGIFKLENELMEDSNAEQLMAELMAAYSALQDSDQAHVREVFSSAIYGQMESVKKFLTGKAIKDMTAIELAELHKMYRLVLHTITTSNDLFAQKRKGDVSKLGEEIIAQLQTPGKEMTPEILDMLAKMGWANLKPETALELIGSDTLTEMMQGLYRGEDTYALDIEHARQYAKEQAKKYGRDKWDMKKSLEFANTKITLGEAMSLYAYTRRRQAQGHLEGDGFTHSSNVRIKAALGKLPMKIPFVRNAVKTYQVPKDVYDRVAQLLTPEQKKYVEAMQEYLSKVMGAKGNEVSMQLYGIPLFLETEYFPLKTAREYHDEALGATKGEVKLRNSGFTQKVQEKARNPIVLDDFESVWAAHVDKMSLYHGFVLPMEDFDRVYNYHRTVDQDVTDAAGEVYKTEKVETNETVKVDIQNKMGKAANDYIESFMRQLNGGVRSDSTEKLFASGVRNFKKAAVMGSLSVAVQQPTAFIRAMAYLDLADVADWKRWLGKTGKPEGKLLDEMYKYAPVALMKHIGGFDPGLGRSTQNYIFGGKGVMNVVDTVAGWLPEHMDQWTWTYIWVCTKRQIHRQHPDLKINSEAFLQKAGERFSQIIRNTQVYDSVLTKSQIMRSKNVFLQMATAFMNEPTTSLDMYIRSTIQAKRGKISKKKAARVYGAVVGSQILVAAVSAFVYAARDDDEDETYWEKYMSAFVGKTKEGLMPYYSIPFVKDIISIFEGYTVERSDMALVGDLAQAIKKLKSDKATPWEKTEAFAGSILNFFGIPLKNVSRDVRSIFNTVKTWGDVTGTNAGMRYAALEGLTGSKAPKTEQLQNAVAENDAAHILRLMTTYKDENSAFSAVRSAVKEVFMAGGITEETAMDFLQVYAGHDAAEAQEYLIKWNFAIDNPNSGLEAAQVPKYVAYAEPAGISTEIYAEYCGKKSGYSKREDILRVIHALPISKKQKDALYFAEGYAESTLDEAPWH